MKKLVAATVFAAVALAAQSAAACDWNREASSEQQQVATSATPTQAPQVTSTATQAPAATAEASKPVEPTAPVVLVNDRH
jgi:hypothetical protein